MPHNHTRRLLRVTGADAEHFLQGLITNDLAKLGDGLVYTAMLTPQGKYLADFFVLREAGALVLDTDNSQTGALVKRLNMYKLRADVTIAEDDRPVARGTGPMPQGALRDPRNPNLGWRLYGTHSSDATDWQALQVEHLIPSSGIELGPDSFILEMGFERLNGVDFKKGCYVGQEVTARMKHKTELRKGLARVDITESVPVGTKITTPEGKDVGTVFTQANGQALAYLRFDRAKGPMMAATAHVSYPAGNL